MEKQRTLAWKDAIRFIAPGAECPSFIEYQPGNGTLYAVCVAKPPEQFEHYNGEGLLLSVYAPFRGVMMWSVEDPHPAYVVEKLDCRPADAVAIIELMSHLQKKLKLSVVK
jgi:hypothetical protein